MKKLTRALVTLGAGIFCLATASCGGGGGGGGKGGDSENSGDSGKGGSSSQQAGYAWETDNVPKVSLQQEEGTAVWKLLPAGIVRMEHTGVTYMDRTGTWEYVKKDANTGRLKLHNMTFDNAYGVAEHSEHDYVLNFKSETTIRAEGGYTTYENGLPVHSQELNYNFTIQLL